MKTRLVKKVHTWWTCFQQVFILLNPILNWQVQDAVLTKWVNDAHRMDKRMLSLIFLAHASDVLENAFAPLNDDDYELAMKRVRELLYLDLDTESAKPGTNELMWAVFASFTK